MINMKAHLILYTATAGLDYRFMAEPESPTLSRATLSLFKKRIRGLLSSETLIKKPKWMLCKEVSKDYSCILWGVACQNSTFSVVPLNDEKGRVIQCFIGLVIEHPDEYLKLPYDVAAFNRTFNEIIERNWKSLNSKPENVLVVVDDMLSTSYIRAGKGCFLNYNQNICRLFPASLYPDELLFSEALSSSNSVSLATSVERKSEVIEPEYEPLMNAILLKSSDDVKDVPVKRICKKCKAAAYDLIDGLCENCRSYRAEEDIKQKSLCIECGKESDDLLNGLCQECIENHNKPVCKKCKRQVDVLYKGGICKDCKKEKSLRLTMVALIALLSIVCLLKCSHSKTHSGIPNWKDAHVFEMTSTQEKTTDTTKISN